jgi:hypothetical protein
MLDSKLFYDRQVYYLHSRARKLLELIRFITYNFSSVDSLKVLYIALIRSKLENVSVVWNIFTSAESNELENIKRNFANLSFNRFIQPHKKKNSMV